MKSLDDMVDVVTGPMKLEQVKDELHGIVYYYSPERVVVEIQKDYELEKYRTTIYINKECFGRKK